MFLDKRKSCLVAGSVGLLCLVLNYEKLTPLISDRVVAVEKIEQIGEERLTSCEDSCEELCVKLITYEEAPVAYDDGTNTIYIPQNLYEENWEGRLKTKEGKLFFEENEWLDDKKKAISEGNKFKLYLVKDDVCHAYNLVFTGMPIMCLNSEEMYQNEEGTEVFVGEVQVYDHYSEGTKLQIADCEYHIRGNTSIGYEKVGYKLELTEEDLPLLGLREDEDWILNALYDDAGLVHNKLSYMMWQEIASYNGVKNDEGVDMQFVEVFIDDEYVGVYGLTERVDQKTLSLNRNDILYKCRSDRIPEEHNFTNEETDGWRPIFLLKYPKNPTQEDWEPLKQWSNYFYKEQFNTYEEGAALLNMENTVDFNIFTLLISGVDNMRKNAFLIAEYQNDGSYLFKKVPWDMNATWGNPWVDNKDSNFTLYDPAYIRDVNTWYTDLSTLYFYDETRVSQLLRDRWWELRQNDVVTKEKICGMIDSVFGYLHDSGAYKRNYERWSHGSEYWQDEYIYEYVDGRIDFLDGYFNQLYQDTVTPAEFLDIDYAAEFDARTYWTKNYETLSELYDYDRQVLLEHYVNYGRPAGLIAKKVPEGTG